MTEERITTATEGQQFKSSVRDEPYTVLAKCEENNGQWYCVTHDEPFQNQLQKDIHIGRGKHQLAWICLSHGVEVP